MHTSVTQFNLDDETNRSIWTESVTLQRKIVEGKTQPLQAGAQQAMPKPCDEGRFSATDPLPWVPDLVGRRFGADFAGVLVVGSSYNGFIEGYSRRKAVLPLEDYVEAKNAPFDGMARFSQRFLECVVLPDRDHYGPILETLLGGAGCPIEDCCITDLCKASFVERGKGPENGIRGDKGSDSVIRQHWREWVRYVSTGVGNESTIPLPYRWLWDRMTRSRVIVALGTIAEYGVLKIFQQMASSPKVRSCQDPAVRPSAPTLRTRNPHWKYAYANRTRKLDDWLTNDDWWEMRSSDRSAPWSLLPVFHPSAAFSRRKDRGYAATIPRLQNLIRHTSQ